MDLLHAEFNNGRLSLEEIKTCLGSDFGQSWPTLQKKFKQDETGLFFNEKLEHEQKKRKAFSESRRQNVLKKPQKSTYVDTSVEHMYKHMENENENTVLVNNINNENSVFWVDIKNQFFNCYWWVEKFCRDKRVPPDELKRQMVDFMVDVELVNEVKTLPELQSHFLHSFNKGKYSKKKDEQQAVHGLTERDLKAIETLNKQRVA